MITSELITRVIDRAVVIQQIPAETFHETQRMHFVRQQFSQEGLTDVAADETGNVYARLPGLGTAPPLLISAHLDTVFPEDTSLVIRREADLLFGPGIGDNSLGVASLFGVIWAFKEISEGESRGTQALSRLPGDIWLVANVGEEGLGDLRGMKAVVDCFTDRPLAYIILEGMGLGVVYHRGLGVRRYRITIETTGGHSWINYGNPSAIHELAGLTDKLTALSIPGQPRSSLNVGVIAGGISVNTIAAEAHLELDLRSEGADALKSMIDSVEALVQGANRAGVRATCKVIGNRPSGSISSQHWLVQLAQHTLQELGIQPNLSIGSTDANIPLSRGLPAVCIGLSQGDGAHTTQEFVNLLSIESGLFQLTSLVQSIFARRVNV